MPTLSAPDRPKFERPNLEMPDIDLSKIDLPKVDVGKAVNDAATAVGLMRKQRARWPFVIGAGIAVAVAGWAWMNADMLRRRFSEATTAVSDRIATLRSDTDFDESVAFTAAEPKPIDETDPFDVTHKTNGSSATTDYPTGFGASDMAGTSGDLTSTKEKASSRS